MGIKKHRELAIFLNQVGQYFTRWLPALLASGPDGRSLIKGSMSPAVLRQVTCCRAGSNTTSPCREGKASFGACDVGW